MIRLEEAESSLETDVDLIPQNRELGPLGINDLRGQNRGARITILPSEKGKKPVTTGLLANWHTKCVIINESHCRSERHRDATRRARIVMKL